jgi:hypothetical protein
MPNISLVPPGREQLPYHHLGELQEIGIGRLLFLSQLLNVKFNLRFLLRNNFPKKKKRVRKPQAGLGRQRPDRTSPRVSDFSLNKPCAELTELPGTIERSSGKRHWIELFQQLRKPFEHTEKFGV